MTVDKILKQFNKMIKQLDKVRNKQLKEADYYSLLSEVNAKNADECLQEAERAEKVRNKLKELVQ